MKKNNTKKNDLKHLSRRELIELICEMKKTNPSLDVPELKEAEKEQKRLRRCAAYRQTFRGTIAVLIVVAAVSVLVATLWMPVLQIYGSSMSPTLEPGQIVVSVKNNRLKTGDIVAFWQGNKLLIKRVIAGPGQWVDIDANGTVTVDGQILDEPYIREPMAAVSDYQRYIVPEGHYFAMGDNRNSSLDSRYWDNKYIARDKILAKAVFKYYKEFKILK